MIRVTARRPAAATILAAALLTAALPATGDASAQTFVTEIGPVSVEQVGPDARQPWGLAPLPDGRVLVTLKEGALLLFDGDQATQVGGAPAVTDSGQGGLLDVAVPPDFEQSRRVFMTFSERRPNGAVTSLARATLAETAGGPQLTGLRTIWRMTPVVGGGRHFGSRIVFGPSGELFVTTGDRGERPLAQDLDTAIGKVIRVDPEGAPMPDNPYLGTPGALPELYSIGHRNIQGADLDPETGRLWTVEHGARGGDEINQPQPGLNYGWPVISYGRHYSGFRIGEGTEKAGMEQPKYYWDPSIAPSGLAIYDGDLFPKWRGDIFVGALKDRHIARLTRRGDAITGEETLFRDQFGRVRDIEVGPDGALWFITDESDGGLYRITPAPRT